MLKPMKKPQIISFGEVLYDVFPEKTCLGGAPLNLAVHLHRLGAEVRLISAVGNDDLGRRAREGVLAQGLSDEFLFPVPHATGQVTVTLDDRKIPSYRFTPDCAYDHIPYPEHLPLHADLFCFGTLAQRGADSKRTLRKLLKELDAKIFCDVNLRQDFFSRDLLEDSLAAADWVKLNEEELPILAGLFGITPTAHALAEKFMLDLVIRTLGPNGCEILEQGTLFHVPAEPVNVVSTVGAGDSFSAAFLYHYLSGKTAREAAVEGNRLAAEVAGYSGAF